MVSRTRYTEPWIVEGTGLETTGHFYPWPNESNCSQGKHRTDPLTERFLSAVGLLSMVRSLHKEVRSFHIMARLATSRLCLFNPSLVHSQLKERAWPVCSTYD